MQQRFIHKASPVLQDEEVESVTLNAHDSIDEALTNADLRRTAQVYDHDAKQIMLFLEQLPQGTTDRLLARLMHEKATLLKIQQEKWDSWLNQEDS